MNLSTLSNAISATGVALLDSNSTVFTQIIHVRPSRCWSAKKEGLECSDLRQATAFKVEDYDFSNEVTQYLFAEALRLYINNVIAVSGANEEQQLEHRAFKLLNVILPRLFNHITIEESDKLNKMVSFIRYENYGIKQEQESWFAGYGAKAPKEECRKFFLLPQHLDKLSLLPVDYSKGVNPTVEKGYLGCFTVFFNPKLS